MLVMEACGSQHEALDPEKGLRLKRVRKEKKSERKNKKENVLYFLKFTKNVSSDTSCRNSRKV